MATTRIMELAASISKSVAEIQKALSERKIPSPSFNENAPSMLPKELADAQNTVLEATAELRDLLQDPLSLLHEHCAVSLSPAEFFYRKSEGVERKIKVIGPDFTSA
jgi:hypothetical protein